jgi:two-component system, NarL family, nitrate/nitrite response regulator NarL
VISVVIVAATRLFREGLAQALDGVDTIVLAGTAGSCDELARFAGPVDIVLLDLPSVGIDSIRAAREALPEAAVLGIGVGDDVAELVTCVEAGLAGFVSREASFDDLAETIVSVARGEMRCSPEIAGTLMRRVASLAAAQPLDLVEASLTRREREIVDLIESGLSNKEIALRLGIELATVKKHVHHILDKLHVSRRLDAADWSRRRKLART